MAVDPRKRQKKLERRAAKRKNKHQLLVKEKSAGLSERMADASRYPVLDCFASEVLWEQGMGIVTLSRQLPNGSIAVGTFLVDRYCLGVKNAHAAIVGRFTYDDKYLSKVGRSRKLTPEAARKLIEGAVAYAHRLGFGPHPDYQKARHIFGNIDASTCTEEFEFGKDGKPLFIAGPHDSPERCHTIMNTLQASCGPGGSDYLIPVGPGGAGLGELFAGGPELIEEIEDAAEDEGEDSTAHIQTE